MSIPLLLSELAQFIEDDNLMAAARAAVVHLNRGLPAAVVARRVELASPEAQEREFEGLWNTYVEPEGAQTLNSGDVSPNVLAYRMSYQGVVIDHVIKLFAAGGVWWDRAHRLVLKEAAETALA